MLLWVKYYKITFYKIKLFLIFIRDTDKSWRFMLISTFIEHEIIFFLAPSRLGRWGKGVFMKLKVVHVLKKYEASVSDWYCADGEFAILGQLAD